MASKSPIRVAVTGAAGNIGYAAIFRLASGAVFGADQPVALNLIEVGPGLNALAGVVMELQDCAFPLLTDVVATGDLNEGFKDADWCLLIGAVPRKEGMERKDLLGINGKIFIGQGEAIARNAKKSVKVLVVGNPCNTNALIALRSAGSVPTENFFAMTRLDENRAKSQLAGKAGAHNSVVKNVAIWGNHSSTQYPDFTNATIGGQPAMQVITDHAWLKETFVSDVQKRGAAVIRPVVPPRPPQPPTPRSIPCAASTSRPGWRMALRRGPFQGRLRHLSRHHVRLPAPHQGRRLLGNRAGSAARRLLQGEDRDHREGTARGARHRLGSPRT